MELGQPEKTAGITCMVKLTVDSHSAEVYPIFLSSLCGDEASHLRNLRSEIYYDVGCGMYVYVDECVNAERGIQFQHHLDRTDELFRRIREASTFICILGGHGHGTAIAANESHSRLSFFELELFQAALLKKEIHLFVQDDFTPGPRLEALLETLKFAYPEWRTITSRSPEEIRECISALIDQPLRSRTFTTFLKLRAPIRHLVQALYTSRRWKQPTYPVLFQLGLGDAKSELPRHDFVEFIRNEIEQQSSHEKQLSRILIGLRELEGGDGLKTENSELLMHWNYLLGKWSSSGAWYGLHGHTPLGCLAAINRQKEVRERMSKLHFVQSGAGDTSFPGGALASSKYSIAKLLIVKKHRVALFNDALRDLERSFEIEQNDKSGLLAVRGSINLRLGRHADAVRDYEEALQIRINNKSSVGAIGDARSELGFGYLWHLSPRKALRNCEQGVAELRTSGETGFLARGLRKLAITYLVNGQLRKAYEAREEARKVALEQRALDQYR